MATQINKITALSNAINAYIVDMADEWQTPIRNEMELEPLLDHVYCLETYAEPSVEFKNVIQAYQGRFTSTGVVNVGSVKNTLQTMKSDLDFDEEQLEKWAFSQFPMYHPAGQDQLQDNRFVQKLLNEEYFEAWKDEMNKVAVKGVRVAPTSGTAGTVLGSVDGFDKVFADGIAAGSINTITTGALTEEDIYDQVAMSLDAITKNISKQGGTIWMSPTVAVWYSRAYKAKHPHATPVINDPAGKIMLVDEYPKFVIRELTEKSNTNIWIDIKYRGRTNMIVGKHKVFSDMPSLTTYPEPRMLKCTSSWHRFYGLRRYEHTFVTKVS
jgi:hypothetical protein